MADYVEVQPHTDIWWRCKELFSYKENWAKHQEKIEEFIGFPITEGVYMNTESLQVTLSALEKYRPEWKPYFKQDGCSRVRSVVHKQWLELVEECELKVYGISHVSLVIEPWGSVKAIYPFGDRYFIEVNADKFKYEAHSWAQPVKESEFLRIQADYLDAMDSAP